MRFMTIRIMAALLLPVILTGHSYGGPLANPAGRQLTISLPKTNTPPPQSSVRPEDLLWSSAQECLKKAQYKEARQKFAEFARQYRNDTLSEEAWFYQGLCEFRLGQESQALNLWDQVLRRELPDKTEYRT